MTGIRPLVSVLVCEQVSPWTRGRFTLRFRLPTPRSASEARCFSAMEAVAEAPGTFSAHVRLWHGLRWPSEQTPASLCPVPAARSLEGPRGRHVWPEGPAAPGTTGLRRGSNSEAESGHHHTGCRPQKGPCVSSVVHTDTDTWGGIVHQDRAGLQPDSVSSFGEHHYVIVPESQGSLDKVLG